MGLLDRYIKQVTSKETIGLTIFYLTALFLTIVFHSNRSSNNKIDNVILDNNVSEIKDSSINDNKTDDNMNTSPSSPMQLSPIKVIASPSIHTTTSTTTSNTTTTISTTLDNEFVIALKKGIKITRVKSTVQKKKILKLDDNFKLSIKSPNSSFISFNKKIKEWPISLIDSIIINNKNDKCFSLFFKEGRIVSKYEISTESTDQCKYLMEGLLNIKEFEANTVIATFNGTL